MHARSFILILLLPSLSNAQPELTTPDVVKLRRAEAHERIRAMLDGKDAQVLGDGEQFLVIRRRETTPPEQYERFLERLRKDPEVEGIVGDSLVYPRSVHAPLEPADSGRGERASDSAIDARACRVFPRCGNSNPAWARLQVGADLAEQIVQRVVDDAPRARYARVAVVDSGFDTRNQAEGLKAVSFSTAKGHDSAGHEDTDPDGHGTAVAGMIAGRTTGVTHQVELKVFRVTEKHAGGSVSNALLAAAIEKACKTSDVVNVSWGNLFDELGLTNIEDELWYKKAVETGCLIVKSSGNGGYRRKGKEIRAVPLEAPFLAVAASDEFSEEATFSTTGGIMAPGAGVFSTLSAQHEYGESTTSNACTVAKSRLGPINGTSFSAPLVAGVAGQVITILRSRGVLPQDPAAKIRLVKSILLASAQWSMEAKSRHPVVSALAAALIARSVTADGKTDTASLIAGARKEPALREQCAIAPADCTGEKNCPLKKACVNRLRFHSLACEPPPPGVKAQPGIQSRLFAALQQLDERELLTQLIDRLPSGGALAKQSVAELNRQWDAMLDPSWDRDRIGIADFTRALNLLSSARRSDVAKGLNLPRRLREVLRSFSLSDGFKFAEPLGTSSSQRPREEQAARFLDAFRLLPVKEQVSLLGELPYQRAHFQPQVDFLYYLHANRDGLDGRTRSAMEERMRRIAEEWFEGKRGELTLHYRSPAFEAVISYLPKAAERIQAAVKKPLTDKNRHLFQYGLISKTALGKGRLEMVEKLLGEPKLKDPEMAYLLGDALKVLVSEGSAEAVERTGRRVLLENPIAGLPRSAISGSESQLTPQQKALGKDDFFPRFIRLNVKQGIEKLSRKETEYVQSAREIENVMKALEGNILMPKESRKALLTGPAGQELKKFLEVAAGNVVKAEANILAHARKSAAHPVLTGSFETVEAIVNAQALFAEAGFQTSLRDALGPLKADMLKSPAKYTQSFRQKVKKLYELDE